MRSALVSNIHLGRLLVRRLGRPATLRFFRESASFKVEKRELQLSKICEFICESSEGVPPTLAEALERHTHDLTVKATVGFI